MSFLALPRSTKRLSLVLVALVATSAFAQEEVLAVGTQVPRFTLPVVNAEFSDGKKWGPAKWVGEQPQKKLIILSFFATYCEPCKKEMPELVRLYDAYKDQGLGVMLVSIDKGLEQRDEVVALAQKNGVKFPVLHDRFQVVARRFKAERLPYMLMVGADGAIRTVHVGYTEELKASLENEVRGHLGLAALAAAAPVVDERSGTEPVSEKPATTEKAAVAPKSAKGEKGAKGKKK
jgi:thiol-disulfide isomerase/thioredoxin